MDNPYPKFVAEVARRHREARSFPFGGFQAPARPEPAPDAPRILIFSPHPDDECIVGGLALRLMLQSGCRVINVAVTQGSREDRQLGRWKELQGACGYLGFGLAATGPRGLSGISRKGRASDPEGWSSAVGVIAGILEEHRPAAILFPHDCDWNSTHIGVHDLVVEAMGRLGDDFETTTVETEFWGAMDDPNLMVELTEGQVGDLMSALSFHEGEVRRNPFHLLFPAWLQDNVRRGSELVGGQGAAAPDFSFATLYRVRTWRGGRFSGVWDGGRVLSAADDPGPLIPGLGGE